MSSATSPPPAAPPSEPPGVDTLAGTGGPRRAGEPAPPGSFEGRARAFREQEAERRSSRRQAIGAVLVVILIVLGVYTLVTARPYSSQSYNLPTPGPLITVDLGPPSVGSVACVAGGTAQIERISFEGASRPISTGNVFVRISEIWDGDFIGDPGVAANVTPSDVCAGSPPDATSVWYVVLAAPNGTNLFTYTVAHAWVPVARGPANLGIKNGSSFVVITDTSLAGTGRGFSVVGTQNGSLIRGVVPL